MQHMCSTRAAVLFYSKSYQRMKDRPAQRGVSWHQRLRQEGKSQKVEASHMCCPGDEKLRCNTAVLFYFFFFLPYCSGQFVGIIKKKKAHSLQKSWWLCIIFLLFFLDKLTSLKDLLHSWKAYAVDGKNSLDANKMAARKVPVVQSAMQAAAKLRGTTAVNKERVLVL